MRFSLLYTFCLHFYLINISVFDYPDSRLSGLFTKVPTSPDNRGSTVRSNLLGWLPIQNIKIFRVKTLRLEPLINSPASLVSSHLWHSVIDSLFAVHCGRDPFNQNSNRSDREKWSISKGGPVFSKLFRLDRTDPLSFGPKFPEILVEWIAPCMYCTTQSK